MEAYSRLSGPAKITIEVSGPDEKTTVLEATSDNVVLERDVDYDSTYAFYTEDRLSFVDNAQTTLTATLDDPYVIKVIDKRTYDVIRTARVRVEDMTLEALNEARTALGVPKHAQFHFTNSFLQEAVGYYVGDPRPAEVEFSWKEAV